MRRAWLWPLVLQTACGEVAPEGQVLLYVDTDAPLPAELGQAPGEGASPALFDSLRVDVYPPGAGEPCAGCSRTFSLNRGMLERAEASFGLPLEPGVSGYRARLRLFDSRATLQATVPEAPPGAPPPQSVIDVTVALPEVAEEGKIERTVVLEVERVGLPVGSLEQPVPTLEGPPESSRVGTWSGAERRMCRGEPLPGEVCIGGGAFWMGNPRVRGGGIGDAHDQRRLVTLAPFYMDATEVTVADYRAFADRDAYPIVPWTGDRDGDSLLDMCTFTEAPGPHEDHPVTCVSYAGARAYCQAKGGDLPTEAQLEYVFGGLQSNLFVWGTDVPACADAVLLRWSSGTPPGVGPLPQTCPPLFPPGSSEPVGALAPAPAPRLDRLELEGGTLYDLVGNVAEWARDRWNRQDEPCWTRGGVHREPECDQPSIDDNPLARVFRGGSFLVGPRQAVAAARGGPFEDNAVLAGQGIDLGFRCIRPGE